MLRISIKADSQGNVVFEPNPASTSVSLDGGSFMFENYDIVPHQPNPVDSATYGVWCPDPIPAGSPTQATPSILNTYNKVALINYACQLQPGLTGAINFTA